MAGASIERQRGMLHRFLDDGVVGVFSVPLEDFQQEDHALRAGINIVRLMSVMRDKWVGQNPQAAAGRGRREHRRRDRHAATRGSRAAEYTIVGSAVAFARSSPRPPILARTSWSRAKRRSSRSKTFTTTCRYRGSRSPVSARCSMPRSSAAVNAPTTLPKVAFANTVIDGAAEAELPEALREGASAATPPPAPPPPPEPAAPEPPPLRTRPVARPPFEGRERRGFDLPELRFPSSFGERDEEPITRPASPAQPTKTKAGLRCSYSRENVWLFIPILGDARLVRGPGPGRSA